MTDESVHPFSAMEEEELKDYVLALLRGAMRQVEASQFTASASRLANALGAVSFLAANAPGIASYTQMGFKLAVMVEQQPSQPAQPSTPGF